MRIHEIEQGTAERYEVRQKKLTASHATAIAASGKGLETYIYNKLSEYYSSAEKEEISNIDIDRGNELEPLARSMYELETGNTVAEVGFIEYNEYVGCSPDGLIGDDGGVEIKCFKDSIYFRLLAEEKIKSDHIRQMQMCMLITGRKWRDYVAYNPNFKKSLWIKRIEADEEKHEKLLAGLEKGVQMLKEVDAKYKSLLLN